LKRPCFHGFRGAVGKILSWKPASDQPISIFQEVCRFHKTERAEFIPRNVEAHTWCERRYFKSWNERPFQSGLPDFSSYNIPKREKIYQITIKYTEWPHITQNSRKRLNGHTIYQHLHCKTLEKFPKFVFFVWNYAIWQPWFQFNCTLFRIENRCLWLYIVENRTIQLCRSAMEKVL
jgi:hypothetical protein